MTLEVSISHSFGSFKIDADFITGCGVTAIFGPSGAGKSTIVNAIAGLLRPQKGRISQDGEIMFDSSREIMVRPSKRRIGYVFQDGRLFPHLSVAGNIRFGVRFSTGSRSSVEEGDIAEILGLSGLMNRRPGTLSGGEKQRVALARALLSNPRLLLMDEPLASLDESRKDDILPYIERLRDVSKVPIVYVSHSMAEVSRLADHLVVLKMGKVFASDTAQSVLSDPEAMPYVGVREAGAIVLARVLEHERDGLTRLRFSGGDLLLPGVGVSPVLSVRVRILAKDIILSLAEPTGLSSNNILPVTVESVHRGDGPGVAVQVRAGRDSLLSRLTARAASEMQIAPGMSCYAILNATAVPRVSISAARPT